MKYLGVARKENGHVLMPDSYRETEEGRTYEVVEVEGDILLSLAPLDRERIARVERIAERSIEEHRKTLEGLAR